MMLQPSQTSLPIELEKFLTTWLQLELDLSLLSQVEALPVPDKGTLLVGPRLVQSLHMLRPPHIGTINGLPPVNPPKVSPPFSFQHPTNPPSSVVPT